jgi:hypothetical protein
MVAFCAMLQPLKRDLLLGALFIVLGGVGSARAQCDARTMLFNNIGTQAHNPFQAERVTTDLVVNADRAKGIRTVPVEKIARDSWERIRIERSLRSMADDSDGKIVNIVICDVEDQSLIQLIPMAKAPKVTRPVKRETATRPQIWRRGYPRSTRLPEAGESLPRTETNSTRLYVCRRSGHHGEAAFRHSEAQLSDLESLSTSCLGGL